MQAIVVTPTRELALQVKDEIESLRGSKRVYVLAVYGGQPIAPQIDRLRRGVQIVVGTPGRVIDHLERRTLSLEKSDTSFLMRLTGCSIWALSTTSREF